MDSGLILKRKGSKNDVEERSCGARRSQIEAVIGGGLIGATLHYRQIIGQLHNGSIPQLFDNLSSIHHLHMKLDTDWAPDIDDA